MKKITTNTILCCHIGPLCCGVDNVKEIPYKAPIQLELPQQQVRIENKKFYTNIFEKRKIKKRK
jgi:hypothetical protein